MKNIIILATVIISVTGCNSSKDASYFRANPSERDNVLHECRKKTGSFSDDKDCFAALSAEDVKTVTYWKSNPIARKIKLMECKDHAGTIGKTENCVNAQAAQVSAFGSGSNPIYVLTDKPSSASK